MEIMLQHQGIESWHPTIVMMLFVFASAVTYFKKRFSPGAVFLSFALVGAFLGIIPSKYIMSSFINRVTVLLFCYYFLMQHMLETGYIELYLSFLQKLCRNRLQIFYLASSFLASFFPFHQVKESVLYFFKQPIHMKRSHNSFLSYLVFATSSLTLIGSKSNMTADYICNSIFAKESWGFFSKGFISLYLFLLCFCFWTALTRQKISFKSYSLLGVLKNPFIVLSRPTVPYKIEKTSHEIYDRNRELEIHIKENPRYENSLFKKRGGIFLLLFLILVLCGLAFHIAAIFGFLALFISKDFRSHFDLKKFPLDSFFMLIASLLFAFLAKESGLAKLLAGHLTFFTSKAALVSFFLLTSAFLSMYIDSLMVVSIMLSISAYLPACQKKSFMQLVAAAVTFSSYFFLATQAEANVHKQVFAGDDYLGNKVSTAWAVAIFLVFFFYTISLY